MTAPRLRAGALFLGMYTLACSATNEDTLCFRSESNPTLRLEFHTVAQPTLRLSFGAVKYGSNSRAIPLVAGKSTQETQPGAANPVSTSTWTEIIDERISGTYELTVQGGQVLDLTYLSKSNKRKMTFYFDPGAEVTKEGACIWTD